MNNALPIEDLSKTYLEHSMVINNFVIKIGSQIKDSLCRVFGDGVQYEWRENDDKIITPDVSIICNLRKWIFTVRWESLNTGSLTGEKNLWKFIFLILEKMVLGIPIFTKPSPLRIKTSCNW